VKTTILRRLPVLVYNPQSSKVVEGGQKDPSITSLYFDNPKFSLYTNKVDRRPNASSLRLRWFGQLNQRPEIFFEKKTVNEMHSDEKRFPIKEKYIQPFIKGEYKMEKSIQKMSGRAGQGSDQVEQFERTIEEIQSFIKDQNLRPVVRANYTRTAFQIPGDDRVRISLDTDLALIREDALDQDRPCRDPDDWHRTDIDRNEMEYPFPSIRKGEISRFPFAILEIKVREEATKKRNREWITELMTSHLVKEAPKFSKFAHGVAQLFEDHVNSFPFWLSELETDIRRDPETAFEEEQQKKAKQAEDEIAVGSFLGSKATPGSFRAFGSPAARAQFGKSPLNGSEPSKKNLTPTLAASLTKVTDERDDGDKSADEHEDMSVEPSSAEGLRSLFPSFSSSRYGQSKRRGTVKLPPGVVRPGQLIKDSGPVKVEPKVWLANQRTFIKWMHVSVLLVGLSVALFNAAGRTNTVAIGLAIVYTFFGLFGLSWAWYTYQKRSRMIRERSGKDFDDILGPMIVSVGLIVALCLNFGFKVRHELVSSSYSMLTLNSIKPC
jgi:uncharacterized membrane protein YidH (DUF202 family)